MARYVMVLRHATSLRGVLEGGGPWNSQLFWARSLPFQDPKKSLFSGPTRSHAPRNDVARLKTIKYKRRINNRYTGNFMYTSVVALLYVVVCRYVGVFLQLCCVCCVEGGRGWFAELPLPLPP
jgi:hypothetical protein